jgi:hypothetical protein
MALPMKCLALTVLALMSTPQYVVADEDHQAGVADHSGESSRTLMILTSASKDDTDALYPVVDTLCHLLAGRDSGYRDVLQFRPDIQVAQFLGGLTPKDAARDSGAWLRMLDGSLKARAIISCHSDVAIDRLDQPVEPLFLFRTHKEGAKFFVSLFTLRGEKQVAFHTSVDLGDATLAGQRLLTGYLEHLAPNYSKARASNPSSLTALPPAAMQDGAPVEAFKAKEPKPASTALTLRWWVWVSGIAILAAGAVAGIVFVGNRHDSYPVCPSGYECKR